MSALTENGHSSAANLGKLTGCFRPRAAIQVTSANYEQQLQDDFVLFPQSQEERAGEAFRADAYGLREDS